MMDDKNFEKEFNLLIVDTFHNILKVELKMINSITKSGLSMREVHLLEIVANDKENCTTVSIISKSFGITLASVTVMVNKLVQGGFLIKNKSKTDARHTYLQLTKKGKKINEQHENFHKNMIAKISKNLKNEEKKFLAKGVSTLNEMFKSEF
ncbi:MAG: MarR family transcriptional regulator [Clostridia bacterium]|nr:MarR family transcriptional regulator [Clostridia bacterium]